MTMDIARVDTARRDVTAVERPTRLDRRRDLVHSPVEMDLRATANGNPAFPDRHTHRLVKIQERKLDLPRFDAHHHQLAGLIGADQ